MLRGDPIRAMGAGAGQGRPPSNPDKELSIALRNLASNMPLTRAKGLQTLAAFLNELADAAMREQILAAQAPRGLVLTTEDSRGPITERVLAETRLRPGYNLREIAKALGVSHMTVKRRWGTPEERAQRSSGDAGRTP